MHVFHSKSSHISNSRDKETSNNGRDTLMAGTSNDADTLVRPPGCCEADNTRQTMRALQKCSGAAPQGEQTCLPESPSTAALELATMCWWTRLAKSISTGMSSLFPLTARDPHYFTAPAQIEHHQSSRK